MVILDSTYGSPGTGWCKTSVFFVMIVRIKLPQASENLSTPCCKVGLGGSVEGATIGEQKIVDGVRLNLVISLHPPDVEEGAVKTSCDADSDVYAFKGVSHHGAENRAEEYRGESTTLLDFIGDRMHLKIRRRLELSTASCRAAVNDGGELCEASLLRQCQNP